MVGLVPPRRADEIAGTNGVHGRGRRRRPLEIVRQTHDPRRSDAERSSRRVLGDNGAQRLRQVDPSPSHLGNRRSGFGERRLRIRPRRRRGVGSVRTGADRDSPASPRFRLPKGHASPRPDGGRERRPLMPPRRNDQEGGFEGRHGSADERRSVRLQRPEAGRALRRGGPALAIARATATDPQIIFADEPTASLDSLTAEAVVEELLQATTEQGRTLIMVTHDPAVASRCNHVAEIHDARIQGRPSQR